MSSSEHSLSFLLLLGLVSSSRGRNSAGMCQCSVAMLWLELQQLWHHCWCHHSHAQCYPSTWVEAVEMPFLLSV